MRSLTIDAFAKINLTLIVQSRRLDGLHEVRTVLQTVDLSDRLTFVSRAGPLRLRCKGADLPEDRTNLVWRAATELWRAGGRQGEPRDLSIVVVKRIPIRAGSGRRQQRCSRHVDRAEKTLEPYDCASRSHSNCRAAWCGCPVLPDRGRRDRGWAGRRNLSGHRPSDLVGVDCDAAIRGVHLGCLRVEGQRRRSTEIRNGRTARSTSGSVRGSGASRFWRMTSRQRLRGAIP